MLTYQKLVKRPLHLHRLTGLSVLEFEQLFDKFQSSWNMYLSELAKNPKRQRKIGGGRHATLETLEDKLLFILVYVRMYPLLFLQGIMFDIEEGNTCIWVHRLLPLLDQALGFAHQKPTRKHRGRNLEELLRDFPELKELGILGDGVERPTRRPKDNEKQKKQYSGKKKRHTRKNIILTNPDTTEVVFLGETQDGTMHDKKALDKEEFQTNIPVNLGVDLGFEGLEIKNVRIVLPWKKPKGKELTELQKQQNTCFARRRIKVEHAIAGIKRNRSVSDIYRNIKENTDDLLMSIACGLHNLRVTNRYQKT
jgi:DDE superfamily endonuclease/Helix-turn-helix of DDE superfamily endonuclease